MIRTRTFLVLASLVLGVLPSDLWAQTALVPRGATWSYLDNGSDQGIAWRETAFDDSTWASGPAELGYGDGGEATLANCGPSAPACNAGNFITTYFRHAFDVVDASAFTTLTLRILRDDGAVVYLNGVEIFRTNMPAGAITSTTLASVAVGGADESAFLETTIDPTLLVDGENLLAVEIHQAATASSDVSFDLELLGPVTRGPYLQNGTSTSIVVRWRTAASSNSRVRYGPAPGSLTSTVDNLALTTEHVVTLTGLTPDSVVCYSVGTTAEVFVGDDLNHCFVVSPAPGTRKSTRVWAIGDSGTGYDAARDVRDSYLAFTGSRRTDAWLMLGDNAYLSGTDIDYQVGVFDSYPAVLGNTVLWPTFGNHDDISANAIDSCGAAPAPCGPYFDSFTLPTGGEAGGLASGTEAYYAFDYANIHFVVLDSATHPSCSPSCGEVWWTTMLDWLATDLAATTQDWIVAYWHHCPYCSGSHNSEIEADLLRMRANVVQVLEDNGVDLVLTGHSHAFERSSLIDGFYAIDATINTDGTTLDAGDGRVDGGGAYYKPLRPAPHRGTVYAVVGSSGGQGGTCDFGAHPLMRNCLPSTGPSGSPGSLVLDIGDNRLNARFIDSTCATPEDSACIRDSFTMVKTDIRVAVSSANTQVNRGKNLAFTLSLENISSLPMGAVFALFVAGPVAPALNVIPPRQIPLPAGGIAAVNHSVLIPLSAPTGQWRLIGVALQPEATGWRVLDSSELHFTVN
jgi:calcineurin-like phosphoesterase family protein/purple acid phosphatase-like protein